MALRGDLVKVHYPAHFDRLDLGVGCHCNACVRNTTTNDTVALFTD